MFNDKYGLTQSVLDGRKTMTRRVISEKQRRWEIFKNGENSRNWDFPYQIIEKIAIAQSYQQLEKEIDRLGLPLNIKPEIYKSAGYKNKMFVSAYDMPHHIEMLNYHVERLQDITDEDCLREGISEFRPETITDSGVEVGELQGYTFQGGEIYATPREAFAALIDKVSGKGTWESNPYVWVYLFKLID